MDSRLSNLRKLLTEYSFDAVFLSSLPSITYLTNYSGFSAQDRDAFLLITQQSQYIFTHGIYREDVKNKIKDFELIDMKRENPISTAVKTIIVEHGISRMGFEAFDLKVSEFDRLTKQIDKEILVSTDLVGKLRIHKSHDEITSLKNACALGDKAFTEILKKIKLGVTENELAAYLAFFMHSNGAEVAFPSIVAFEENAAHPHHMPTDQKLKQNTFVLLDFGVLKNSYCSDMTRTVFFGDVSEKQKHVYETVFAAQQKAIDFITKKLSKEEIIRGAAIDKIARDYIISQGFLSMPHSLGHGIGLEVHESPRLTPISEELLENGMVFSIEPGIYIPGEMGVRIEDLFAIEDNKLLQLTSAPSNLISF